MDNKDTPIRDNKDSPVWSISFRTSSDAMTAYLTINTSTPDAAISEEDITRELKKRGVVFGIQDESLKKVCEAKNFNTEFIAARGRMIEPGQDAFIEYSIKKGRRRRVNKNQVVAEYIPAKPGIDGVTVLGKPLKAKPVQDIPLPNYSFLKPLPENKNKFCPACSGYITRLETNELYFTPIFSLKISPDEMTTTLTTVPLEKPDDITADEIRDFLAEHNIKTGIPDGSINTVFENYNYGSEVVIARGIPAVRGDDGYLKLYFETEVRPTIDEHGRVDFKSLNLIHNVRQGDEVAEVFPPTKGIEGKTVLGNAIKPEPGVPAVLPLGKHTTTKKDNPNVAIAAIEGRVILKEKRIVVEPVFTARRNVDYETGNIEFVGPVVVKKDVKSGFRIKAGGDVQIDGVVEDAVIESDGSVLVKCGFVGRNQGKITAEKDIIMKFCENENLEAKGNIEVYDHVMHCNVISHGMVKVLNGKGFIVGGNILATKGIEVKNLGGDQYTQTAVTVGMSPTMMRSIEQVATAIYRYEEEAKHVAKTIEIITAMQTTDSPLPPEKQDIVESLQKILEKLR